MRTTPDRLWVTSRQAALALRPVEPPDGATVAVVVCHGLVTSTAGLSEARPRLDPYAALAAEGIAVMGLDWPGHGRSGGRRGHLTYRLAVEAAATAAEAASDRWGLPVALAGLGLGGTLAVYAALEHRGIAAVVAQAPMDLRDLRSMRRRHDLVLRTVRTLGRRQPLAATPIPARALVAASDLADDPVLARRLWRHPEAVRRYDAGGLASLLAAPAEKPDLGALSVPTLAAVGDRDASLSATAVRAVAARFGGPAEVAVLPGAGAQLALEHPRAVIAEVSRFLHTHVGAS